jgi:hypothetical protein
LSPARFIHRQGSFLFAPVLAGVVLLAVFAYVWQPLDPPPAVAATLVLRRLE